jgi:dTDP-4-dehydrorhamnose reductase
MLGRALLEALAADGIHHRGFTRAELDITCEQDVARLADYPTIINAAAWTDVDGAEADEEGAHRLNAHAVGVLARHCRAHGATLVNYGTDYVFAGDARSPYPLDAAIAPQNAYGRSKAAGEQVLSDEVACGLRVLHIRTSWLWAPWGKNFVRTIAAASATRPQLRVVDDQRGRPTSAQHLARATLDLLRARAEGLTHVTDAGECTWFDLAKAIVEGLARQCEVVPCSSAEYPRPARRPAYSVLGLDNAVSVLGPRPDWRASLKEGLSKIDRA